MVAEQPTALVGETVCLPPNPDFARLAFDSERPLADLTRPRDSISTNRFRRLDFKSL